MWGVCFRPDFMPHWRYCAHLPKCCQSRNSSFHQGDCINESIRQHLEPQLHSGAGANRLSQDTSQAGTGYSKGIV